MKHQRTLRKPGAEIRKALAGNVRALRARLGISQEELADLCNLHRTYVGAIERAERNVTLSTLELFGKALRVSVPDLLTPKRYDKNT
jgi:transcriptional regulator with XRE-family HTH domain